MLQIDGMVETLKTASAAPVNVVENKFMKANDKFVGDEQSKQQLMVRCVAPT